MSRGARQLILINKLISRLDLATCIIAHKSNVGVLRIYVTIQKYGKVLSTPCFLHMATPK